MVRAEAGWYPSGMVPSDARIKTSSQTAKSAARAGIALNVGRCPRHATTSVIIATTRSAAVRAISSWVSMMRAKTVATEARVATHGMNCRSFRHVSEIASITNSAVTEAAIAGGRALKRTVDSHSMGERIRAEV